MSPVDTCGGSAGQGWAWRSPAQWLERKSKETRWGSFGRGFEGEGLKIPPKTSSKILSLPLTVNFTTPPLIGLIWKG